MKKITVERVFIYIALIFGILFVFLTPPFLSPDEDTHFLKSYSVSKGIAYPIVKNGRMGNSFPKQMINDINKKLEFNGNMKKKYTYQDYFNEQFDIMDYNKKIFISYSTQTVVPIAYTAPSIGIIFSKIMAKIFKLQNVSVSYMLQFARLFSLIFSITLIYFAIKITPIYKKLMASIALIPTSLYLCSMVTYDSLIFACSLLAISIMLRLIFDKKHKCITKKEIIILTILGIVLFNVKIIYSFIYILMFFVPSEKFGGSKRKIKLFSLVIFIILVFTILFKLPINLLNVTSSSDSRALKQYNFIFNHPFKYLGYIYYNLVNQRLFYINTMFGGFGFLDTYLPLAIISLYIIFLPLITLAENSINKYKINNIIKILLAVCIFLSVVAIFTALYTGWTVLFNRVGTKDIVGVQGRYFIPLIFPTLLLLSNKLIKDNKFFDIIRNNYFVIPTLSLLISIFIIIFRFWA